MGGDYKIEAIYDSAFYAKESKSDYLLSLHYLVSWKNYLDKENIWEPYSVVQQLWKLISLFQKHHTNKQIVNSKTIEIASQMVKPIIRPIIKTIT